MITMDKSYETRNGKKVRVLCLDRSADLPVVVLLNNQTVSFYSLKGTKRVDGSTDDLDLLPIDYRKFSIDARVRVKTRHSEAWINRHFAGFDESGRPCAWIDGKTSWSADHSSEHCRTPWDFMELV